MMAPRPKSFLPPLPTLFLLLLCPDLVLGQANTGSVFGQGNLGRGRLTWGNPSTLAAEINKRLATKLPTYQVFSLTAAPGTDFEAVYRGKSRQFKEQVPYWRRKLVNGRYVYDVIGKKEIIEWAPIFRFYANFVVHPRVSLWREPRDQIPNVLKKARSSHKYDGRSVPWTVYKPTPDQLWTSRQLVLTPKEARARRDFTYKQSISQMRIRLVGERQGDLIVWTRSGMLAGQIMAIVKRSDGRSDMDVRHPVRVDFPDTMEARATIRAPSLKYPLELRIVFSNAAYTGVRPKLMAGPNRMQMLMDAYIMAALELAPTWAQDGSPGSSTQQTRPQPIPQPQPEPIPQPRPDPVVRPDQPDQPAARRINEMVAILAPLETDLQAGLIQLQVINRKIAELRAEILKNQKWLTGDNPLNKELLREETARFRKELRLMNRYRKRQMDITFRLMDDSVQAVEKIHNEGGFGELTNHADRVLRAARDRRDFLKGQVLLLDDHRVALLAFTKGLRTQTGGSAKAYYLEGLAHLKDNQPLHALQSFRDARGWGLTRESGPAATGSKVFNSVMSGEMVEVFERELELQFLEGLQDKATNQAKAFQSMFSQETAERAEMDKERGPIGTWFRRLFKAGLYDTVETGVDLYRGGDSVAEARADEVGTVGDEMAKTHIAIGVVKGLRKAGFRLDAIHKMTREQFHAAAEKAWERKMSPEKIDKLRIVMMSHGFSNPDMQDLLSGRDLTEKGVLSGTMVQKMEDTSGWATARYVGKTAGNAVNGWVLATSFAPSAQLGILAGSSRSVSATTTLGEFFAGCNATQHALTRMSESAMGRKALEHVDDFLAIGRSGKGGAARMLALEAGGSMAVSYLAKEIGGEPAAMAADIFMMAGGSSQFWGEAMGKAGLTKDQVQRAALALSRRVQVTGSKLDDVSALALRTRKAIEEAGQGGVDKALLAKIQAELGDLGEHLPGPVQRLRGALGDATAGRNASALEHLKSTGRQVKNKRARLQATQQNAKTMGQAAEEIPRRDLAMPGTRRQAGDLGPDGATVSVDAGGGTRVPQDLAVGGGPRQGGDPLTRSQPGGAATSVNAGGGTRAQRDLGTPGTRRRGGGPATRQQPGGAATSVDAGGGTRAQRDLGEPGTRIGEGNPGTRQQAGGAAATGGGRTGDPSTGSPGTQPAPKIAPEKLRLHTDNPLARTHKADKLMAANRFAEAHDELATLRKGLEQAITENPALRRELEEACLEVVTKQRWAKEAAETFAGCKPLPANTITRRLGEEDDLLVRMAILNSKNPQRAAEFAGTQRMPHLEAMPNPYLKDIGKGVSGKQWVISYVQDAEGAAGEVMRSQSGKAYARAVAVVREVTDDDVAGMAEEIASRVFAAAGRPGPHSRVIQIPAGGRLRDYLVTKVLDSGIDLEDLSPGIPQMMARKKDLAQDLAYRLLFGDPDCHFGNIRISDAGYAQGIDYGGGDFLRSHPDFRDVEAMEGAVTQINRFRSRLKEMVANPGKHGVSEEAARQASEALESAAKRLNVDPSGVPDIPGLGSEDTRQAVLDAVDAIRELKHADLPVESAGSYLNTLSQSSLYQHPIFRTNPAALSDADFSRFVESSMGVHFDFAVKQWGDPNGIVRSAISLEDCAGALREIQENVRPQISDIIEKAMKRVPAAERAYTEKLLLKRIDMLESFLKGKFPPLQ